MVETNKIQVSGKEYPSVNTGKLLADYIVAHRVRQSALGRALGLGYNSIRTYKAGTSMRSNTLEALSHALEHNFFKDLAATLPESYSTDAPIDNSQEQELNEVKQQLALVTAERDVLLRALGRGV